MPLKLLALVSIDVICFFLRKIAAAVKANRFGNAKIKRDFLGSPGTVRNVNQSRSMVGC